MEELSWASQGSFGERAVEKLLWASQGLLWSTCCGRSKLGYSQTTLVSVLWKG